MKREDIVPNMALIEIVFYNLKPFLGKCSGTELTRLQDALISLQHAKHTLYWMIPEEELTEK